MRKYQRKSRKFINVPNFVTADKNGSCIIYQLKFKDERMNNTECLFSAIHQVRYDGSDSIVEDYRDSMILNLRAGTTLPEKYGDLELCWYEDDATLQDIMTMCVI